MSGVSRPSENVQVVGWILVAAGFVMVIWPSFGQSPNAQGGSVFVNLGYLGIVIGIALLLFCFFSFSIPPGYALVRSSGRVAKEGTHFGFPPSDPTLIATGRKTVEIPYGGDLLQLDTPDDGILGIAVTVSYSLDLDNRSSLKRLQGTAGLDKSIEHRALAALSGWIQQKPLPGTLKRALSMQRETENFILGKLTGTSSDALVLHNDPSLYLNSGYPVSDLGIRIHEVNVVAMRPLKNGTGKADWGDGENTAFDAQNIFKQFHAHADSLSNLRKLKEALLEHYPEESDDIEDIYDQVRISMKENRDR